MRKTALGIFTLFALTGSLLGDGATAYQKCAACHGAQGEKPALGKSKVINTMTKAEIVSSLKGYKDGTYGGPMKGLMKGQVATLSEEEMEAIATLIAKQ